MAGCPSPRRRRLSFPVEMTELTTTGEMLQEPPPVSGGRRRSRGRSVVITVLVLLIVLIGVGVGLVISGSHGYYAIAPGTAPVVSDQSSCRAAGGGSYVLPNGKPCVRIVLPAGKAATLDGSIMMVDVLVGPATPWDYLLSKLGLLHRLRDGTVLVPNSAILGTTPPSQLDCQNTQQMVDATQAARVVALRRLGYTVQEDDQGALIYQVGPRTAAAAGGVKCGDLITALDGKPIHTADDLVNAVHALKPGDTVHITAQRSSSGSSAHTSTVQLTAHLQSTPASDGQPAKPNQAFLGVASETRVSFTYPFSLNVEVGQIGGPSAGLALTLGIIDSLTEGQLTGGLHIAATGTIELNGSVGDVGGVAQKAVAVRKAGAKVFFVPVQELAAAKSEAGSMKVFAVSTLTQALDDLQSLGGHVPALPGGQNGSG
jgi:PDZ domain-containing protein